VAARSDATWRDDRHLDRTITSDEEEPMTSQEPADHPAAGRQPDNEVVDQAHVPGSDVQAVMPFDYIDEAIEETMVASDPPALTPRTAVGPPGRDASQVGGQGRRD
jgi:hypothetical protein